MKFIPYLLFLVLGMQLHATEIFSYQLEENQKFESTISFDINYDATAHVLIVKNKDTKQYDMIPFYMDANQKISKLKTASFEEAPELLSHHLNGSILTLIGYQNKALEILDYDLTAGTYIRKSWEDYDKPINIFKEQNMTLFLNPDKRKDEFIVTTISNTDRSEVREYAIPEAYKKSIRTMTKEGIEVVGDQGFIQHSSIAKVQAYFAKGNFYLVEDVEFQNDLSILTINTAETAAVSKTEITTEGIEELKDNNSYIKDGKLFALLLGKKDFELRIHNLVTGQEERKFSLTKDLASIRGVKSKMATYLKESNRFKNKPTVTVNETVNGNYKVNIDYVDKNTYRYYDTMWFLHHMMWQQQMMMMNAGGFGPNPENFDSLDAIYNTTSTQPITLFLNKNLEILSDIDEETRYKFIDKEKYLESLSDNKTIFNESAGFLEDEYRYMYTDKKEDRVFISVKSIKRRPTADEK